MDDDEAAGSDQVILDRGFREVHPTDAAFAIIVVDFALSQEQS